MHGIPDNIRTNDKLFDISQHIINSASAAANYRNALAFKKTPHNQQDLYKRTSKNEAPGRTFGTTDATGAFWWQEEENRKIIVRHRESIKRRNES